MMCKKLNILVKQILSIRDFILLNLDNNVIQGLNIILDRMYHSFTDIVVGLLFCCCPGSSVRKACRRVGKHYGF